MLWSRSAVRQQLENLRSRKRQLSFIDANAEAVGVLQVHLNIELRSPKFNAPAKRLIPFVISFCNRCSVPLSFTCALLRAATTLSRTIVERSPMSWRRNSDCKANLFTRAFVWSLIRRIWWSE